MHAFESLLNDCVKRDGSDIHLKPNQIPHVRINGALKPLDIPKLTLENMTEMVNAVLPAHLAKAFWETHEADFAIFAPGIGRFRVNAFFGKGEPCLNFRYVKAQIPTIESLNLPAQLHRLAGLHRGIALLAGATGSGKSSTLAAIIGQINRTVSKRIITIEDPIEYAFTDDRSLITQREIGLDTRNYTEALRHVLRQDPDIILIGEMRDEETIRTALLASETGHLVFSTLHASTAGQALSRLLDVFPSEEQHQIRLALAANLQTVVCQRLVAHTGNGRVPAVEILFNSPTVRKLLIKNQLDSLAAAIETGGDDGMQTFDQSLYRFVKAGQISEQEAMAHASNPESLRMNLRGIFLDESRRILG